jgi:hypothetical protein
MFWILMVSVCKNPIDELREDGWHFPDAPERPEGIHMKSKRIVALGLHLKGVTPVGTDLFRGQNCSNRFVDGQRGRFGMSQVCHNLENLFQPLKTKLRHYRVLP